MAQEIPEVEDNPKAALLSFITELETFYLPWYERASSRSYQAWFWAQAVSLVSGFATAILAALLRPEQGQYWRVLHGFIIVLPLLGSLASAFLVQTRIIEIEALREQGRETIQRLANEARIDFAAARESAQYTEIHRALAAQVSALEQEQARGFLRIIPKALSFGKGHEPS